MQNLWYIKQLKLFEGVPEEEMKRLAGRMREERHADKALLYSPAFVPDGYQDHFIMVKGGEVSLYHLQDGRKIIFDLIGPNGWLGHAHSGEPLGFSHFAEAAPGTHLCFFSRADFLSIASKNPEILFKLTSALAERIREYEHKIAGQIADARSRILGVIEWYRKKNRARGAFERMLGLKTEKRRLTHERIAQMTGLNRVTVSRSLKELADEDCIAIDEVAGEILVKDC